MSYRIAEAIQECIATAFDDFVRVEGKPGFWYRRYSEPFYAFVVLEHSSQNRCFEVDVVSSVFHTWDRQYGIHQLNRATGLPNLRQRSSSMLMEDVPYKYDDAHEQALTVIGYELRQFAVPWFAAHHRESNADPLVQRGLALMRDDAASTLGLEELKQQLRKEADCVAATKWQRREITILALDLMRWREESQLTRG